MNPFTALLAGALLLAAALPYVRGAKHREARLLAAYLLFVGVFALVAAALYLVLGGLVAATGLAPLLERPWGAAVFLAAIFAPAFVFARRQIKRPPRARELPP